MYKYYQTVEWAHLRNFRLGHEEYLNSGHVTTLREIVTRDLSSEGARIRFCVLLDFSFKMTLLNSRISLEAIMKIFTFNL